MNMSNYQAFASKVESTRSEIVVSFGEKCDLWYSKDRSSLFTEAGKKTKEQIARDDRWQVKASFLSKLLKIGDIATVRDQIADVAALVASATGALPTLEVHEDGYRLNCKLDTGDVQIEFAPSVTDLYSDPQAWERILIRPSNPDSLAFAQSVQNFYEGAEQRFLNQENQKARQTA
jgi:hypothetical protein